MATCSPPVLPPRGKKVIEFRTESLEYSLAEFVEKFGPSLPECVVIKQGFSGDIIGDTFKRNQVLHLCVVSKQTRILTRTNDDTYSMPISFSPRVCAHDKHGRVGKVQPLDQIVDSHNLPVTIQFPRDQTITVGERTVVSNNLPNMTLITSFQETCLLGNFIVDGVMNASVVAVPMYLTQLRVSRIEGIQGDSHENWLRYQLQLSKQSACIEYDLEYGNPNIALYKSSAISGKADYTYVQPSSYSSAFQFLHDVRLKHMTTTRPGINNESHYDYVDLDHTISQEHTYTEREGQATGLGQATEFSKELKSAVTRNQAPPSPSKAATSTHSFRLDGAPTIPERDPIVASSLESSSSKEQLQNPYSNNVPRLNVAPTVQGIAFTQSHVTASRQGTTVTSSHVTTSRQGTTVTPSHVTASRQETMVTSSHVTTSRQTSGEEKQISGVEDITDVENMTIDEVGDNLKALKLHKYVDKFQEEMVDGSILKMLDKSTLMQEFHLGTIEAIRLTKFAENGHVPR